MPRVLLVNCVFGHGSTGKIIESLHNGLIANGWDSYVCYARGSATAYPKVIKLSSEFVARTQSIISKITGLLYSCSPFTTFQLKRIIKTLKPDIVNLHCINANTVNVTEIITFLKETGIPTVVTAHAEFLYTGGCSHSLDCNKWIEGCHKCPQFHSENSQLPTSYFFDQSKAYWNALKRAYADFNNLRVTGVSPWLVSRIKKSRFFNNEHVYWTTNGVDTEIFKMRKSALQKRYQIPDKGKVYLYVTPNFDDPLKGSRYIIEFARLILREFPNDRVIIIGIKGQIMDLPSNVIPISHTANQVDLAEYYSMADVTLLASSRETFSMVTAESLCCGTPVVGFQAGGPESICKKGHVKFVPYGNLHDLTQAALEIEKTDNISSDYIPEFSVTAMIGQYERVYHTF